VVSQTITLAPVTRIEGHLSLRAETESAESGGKKGYKVVKAFCDGEMFRGIENILVGRDPLDAQQITQRICGVCPISHALASIRAQEMAYGIKPVHNGRLLQNLVLAANYIQSHVLHFYHLAALDFVDVKAVLKYTGPDATLQGLRTWIEESLARKDAVPAAPLLPRFERDYVKNHDDNIALVAHYVEALNIRKMCHEMAAVFAGRMPHATALVPGGVTQTPTLERILEYRSRLEKALQFLQNVYLDDLLRVAKAFPQYLGIGRGCGNFLCFGGFPMDDADNCFFKPGVLIRGKWEPLDQTAILEDAANSRYRQTAPVHPSHGATVPDPQKRLGYSWVMAPRYRGEVVEVGPLARVLTNYRDPGSGWMKAHVDAFLATAKIPLDKMPSVLGRHAARGVEVMALARQAFRWLDELEIDGPPTRDFEICREGAGYGLVEAPRGALGHWLSIEDYRIKNYQCVVPTTWNSSPRDASGRPGAMEQAIEGTFVEDASQPIEIGRIIRSFDPCLGCSVH
jgi:ferredoxin hydrogenase large subunit/hydrogenase large subunit